MARAVASTLRLEKISGIVAIKNKDGSEITTREGIKLYAGYILETKATSYAFVSLDGKEAVKIDAASKVEIKPSGNNLEIILLAGNMLSNVVVPVSTGNTSTVRTSSTVTGIRG